jgi:hypothetical protein
LAKLIAVAAANRTAVMVAAPVPVTQGTARASSAGHYPEHAQPMEISNAQAHPDRRDRDDVVIRLLCQSEPGIERSAAGNHRAAERSSP